MIVYHALYPKDFKNTKIQPVTNKNEPFPKRRRREKTDGEIRIKKSDKQESKQSRGEDKQDAKEKKEDDKMETESREEKKSTPAEEEVEMVSKSGEEDNKMNTGSD